MSLLQWGRTLSSAEVLLATFLSGLRLPSFNGAALFQVRKYWRKVIYWRLRLVASMGPHSFKCGSIMICPVNEKGRDASMGPHSFKCGSCFSIFIPCLFVLCFNGAALFQVRKLAPPAESPTQRAELQWGRTLSSAEVRGYIHHNDLPAECFNGAALFQVRKSPNRQTASQRSSGASMGPHSFKCGSEDFEGKIRELLKGFNGAALFQVRKFQD